MTVSFTHSIAVFQQKKQPSPILEQSLPAIKHCSPGKETTKKNKISNANVELSVQRTQKKPGELFSMDSS